MQKKTYTLTQKTFLRYITVENILPLMYLFQTYNPKEFVIMHFSYRCYCYERITFVYIRSRTCPNEITRKIYFSLYIYISESSGTISILSHYHYENFSYTYFSNRSFKEKKWYVVTWFERKQRYFTEKWMLNPLRSNIKVIFTTFSVIITVSMEYML